MYLYPYQRFESLQHLILSCSLCCPVTPLRVVQMLVQMQTYFFRRVSAEEHQSYDTVFGYLGRYLQ